MSGRWLGERLRDGALWPLRLARELRPRLERLAAVAGARPHALAPAIFDLVGGPELAQLVMHLGMRTTRLTAAETRAIASVLGPRAIDYRAVRIAEGGILAFVFRLNGRRAFATWHTIHMPTGSRSDLSLLVHEATHVYQYERVGTAYIVEALAAQRQMGRACYDYGGAEGLVQAHAAGKPFAHFNREAQAQIAQDYYRCCERAEPTAAYRPYLAALRAGLFG